MKSFYKELRIAGIEFKQFILDKKLLVLFTLLFSLLSNSPLLINAEDVLTDSETYITYFQDTMDTFIKVGRFGLVLSKQIFSTDAYVPILFAAYTIVTMCLACLLFDFCTMKIMGGNKKQRVVLFCYIFNALYLANPVFPHQFYFKYQAFEVALAFCFCIISAYCAFQTIYEKKSKWWCVLSVGFMVWGFATYQVLVPFYIAVNTALYILCYLFHEKEPECSYFSICLHLVLLFLAGLVSYFTLSRVIIDFFYGTAPPSHLMDTYVCWGKLSFSHCVRNILGDVSRVIKQGVPCYSRFFAPIAIFFTCFASYIGYMKKKKGYGYFLLAVLLTVGSVFLMTLVMGEHQIVRAQMVFPFVLAFCAAMLVIFTNYYKRVFALAATVFMLVLMGNQLKITHSYYERMHRTSAQDRSLAETIYEKTLMYRDASDPGVLPMVFIGAKKSVRMPSDIYAWDALGLSFFEIDHESIHGSIRIYSMMSSLGLETERPSQEQYDMAVEASNLMSNWPEEGSIILKEGVIIVKLSEHE